MVPDPDSFGVERMGMRKDPDGECEEVLPADYDRLMSGDYEVREEITGSRMNRRAKAAPAGQMLPYSTCCLIQGMTTSSISLSEVVARNPSTRSAFDVSGTRFCTS